MNLLVALMFVLQLSLAALGALGNHVFLARKDAGAWYLETTGWVLQARNGAVQGGVQASAWQLFTCIGWVAV